MEFTKEFKDYWTEAYTNGHNDPHKTFADLIGVDRNTAKRLCYEYMYSISVVKAIMDDNQMMDELIDRSTKF